MARLRKTEGVIMWAGAEYTGKAGEMIHYSTLITYTQKIAERGTGFDDRNVPRLGGSQQSTTNSQCSS